MVQLRRYQELAVQHSLQRIQDGCLRMYEILPTATGKSLILASVAEHRLPAGRVLVLIHRQDIAMQLVRTLEQMGLTVGLLMQGHRELTAPVVVATTQSLTSLTLDALIQASEQPIATVLIDEAHHAVAGSTYDRILTTIDQVFDPIPVPVIGYTATPYRSDKQTMQSLLPTCVFERTIPDMVRGGWLAPLIWEPMRVNIDLAGVATTRPSGEIDYAEDALADRLIRTAITDSIAQQTAARIGERPTLAFCASVEHAEQLAGAFLRHGVRAEAVSGGDSRARREQVYADWRLGEIQVVCNCSLLVEGFDHAQIAAVVIARPTLSPSRYIQMLGRGTRPAPGKQNCLVIDVMGNRLESARQVILPDIIGEVKMEQGEGAERSQQTDPLLKALLGAETETDFSLLDPIGQSHYWWTAYRHGYFATVGKHKAVIVERDPSGSGLYHSRLYFMWPGEEPEHIWIQQDYLPLRQQVALIHEFTSGLYESTLGSKDAKWLKDPATEMQITTLGHFSAKLADQAVAQGWTKEMASKAITYCKIRRTLLHPPTTEGRNS